MTGIKSRSLLLPPTASPREGGIHVNGVNIQFRILRGTIYAKRIFWVGGEDPLTGFASCWGRQAKKAETQRGEAEP